MIDAATLKQVLDYDPLTGVFRWKKAVSNRVRVGSVAGSINNEGYVHIKIAGLIYKAHRLAWIYMTGSEPSRGIDHEDRNRSNNAWDNLREADQAQNSWNRLSSSSNATGFKGVVFKVSAGKFAATIKVRRKAVHLGFFQDAALASAAYREAVRKYHGCFAAQEGDLT